MSPERQALYWLAFLAVLLFLVGQLSHVLLPFAAGAIIAYFLDPLTSRLARAGVGRAGAAGLLIGLATLAIAAALFFLLPLAIEQLRQLALTLPADLERIRDWLEASAAQHLGSGFPGLKAGLERALSELAQGTSGLIGTLAQGIWNRGLALASLASLIVVTPVVAFYLLRDWSGMLERIDGWLPREHAPTIRRLAGDIDAAVGAFVRGQGTICFILGAFYAVALSLIGLRYGLLIGLATGALAFVPMVGWAAGLVAALLVALTQGWPDTTLALWVLGIYAAGMAIDSSVLSPGIVGRKVGLHPVWLMLSLFVFGALFGMLGVLVAVPVAAAIAVLVRFARDRYLESPLYVGRTPAGPES